MNGLKQFGQRLSQSFGSITLQLFGEDDPDEVEAFIISVFEITQNKHPMMIQDKLSRDVASQLNSEAGFSAKSCGVEIVATRQSVRVKHGFDGLVSVEELAQDMLNALAELRDPAGMLMAGMAAATAVTTHNTHGGVARWIG